MTESSDTFEVKLSPSRPRFSWRGFVLVLALLSLFAIVGWALTTFGQNLPGWALGGLFLITYIPIFALFNFVSVPIHEREHERNLQTLRIAPTRIEYCGRQEFLSCDRASLRIRRLRLVHGIPDEGFQMPDAMVIELSGPGLRPLTIYKSDRHSDEMWKQIDEVIRRLPEFTVNRHDWTKLRAALGLEH